MKGELALQLKEHDVARLKGGLPNFGNASPDSSVVSVANPKEVSVCSVQRAVWRVERTEYGKESNY